MFLPLRGRHSKVKAFFTALVILTLLQKRYLWNPLDLCAIANDGMSIAIFFKLNVPEVQHTGNNSKEMLITRDIPLESRFPQLRGVVLLFAMPADKQNLGQAEGSESTCFRYVTTSCHHAVPKDRALHPHTPSMPPKIMSYSILNTSPKQDCFHPF